MNKILSLLAAVLLIIGGYFSAPYFIGAAPTEKFTPLPELESNESPQNPHQADAEAKSSFPELNRLRQEVKAQPENLELLTELANNLKGKVIATRDKQLIFELIDILNKILIVDEKNTFALLELANITFESKVFSKAKEYYQRYLDVKSDDTLVRTRYASSLIFLKELDLAIAELDQVIKLEPENFSALSYKAIAYAEANQKDKAIKTGEVALLVAPSQEVKTRFSSYLDTLIKTDDKKTVLVKSELEQYLKTNQVTASKFSKLEEKDTELLIYFKDFPMSQMPEFAKEKFFNSLKTNLQKDQANNLYSKIQKVIFFDQTTQRELDSLSLN